MFLWSFWSLLNEEASKEKPWGEELCEPNRLCPKAAGLGATGDSETLPVRALSPRGDFEEDSCSQTSDQAILHKRSTSLMLVQWHLELVAVFLHHTVLFKNVIYRRKKQACPENLILSWLLVLYWKKALLTSKPVWTRRNSSQCPSSLSARKGGAFTGIIIVMWICFLRSQWDMTFYEDW